MSESKFFIGIDFGTTNIVIAYKAIDNPQVSIFKVPQLISEGLVAELSYLPAMRVVDMKYKSHPELFSLPWGASDTIIGELAKERYLTGDKNVIVSVKSWLDNPLLDPDQNILPLGVTNKSVKVSVRKLLLEYVNYIVKAWNYKIPDAPFTSQEIVVTIPASFHEVARKQVQEAFINASVSKLKMLEEPQAAFYHWLDSNKTSLKNASLPDNKSVILVCDVGGGTTDFSLILFESAEGNLNFKRIAVGDHLLLGGDNMDFSILYFLKIKYKDICKEISDSELLPQIRFAKERLLMHENLDYVVLKKINKGSSIIRSDTQDRFLLTRDDIQNIIIEPFFPDCSLCIPSDIKNRSGIKKVGLNYASDIGITRHLAKFLIDSSKYIHSEYPNFFDSEVIIPSTILFNGGVFYSNILRQAILERLSSWSGGNSSDSYIEELLISSPSLAVAKGAVYSQHAVISKDYFCVETNAPVSYFIKVGGTEGKLLCLLSKGTLPNQRIIISEDFNLNLGVLVSFPFYSCLDGEFCAGKFYNITEKFNSLSQLDIELNKSKDSCIIVHIESMYNDLGILEVAAVDKLSSDRYILEFNPSHNSRIINQNARVVSTKASQNFDLYGLDDLLVKYFVDGAIPYYELSDKFKKYPLSIDQSRLTYDILWDIKVKRFKNIESERHFLHLLGRCIVPGIGHMSDHKRMLRLKKFYDEGLKYKKNDQNLSEWCIFWRRAALGLSADLQQNIYDDLKIWGSNSKSFKLDKRAVNERLRLMACLNKIHLSDRVLLGDKVCNKIKKTPHNNLLWWIMARIGSQNNLIENVDSINIDTIELWIKSLLQSLSSDTCTSIQAKSLGCMAKKYKVNDGFNISNELFDQVCIKISRFKKVINFITLEDAVDKDINTFIIGDDIPLGFGLL